MNSITINIEGKSVIIDLDKQYLLYSYNWLFNQDGYLGRVFNGSNSQGRYTRTIFLHDDVFGEHPQGYEIDHINRNILDNRLVNLRLANKYQQNFNASKRKGSLTSKHKGVSYRADNKTWRAQIQYKKTKIMLSSYNTEDEAGYAYNVAANFLFKEFAVLNTILNLPDVSKIKIETFTIKIINYKLRVFRL